MGLHLPNFPQAAMVIACTALFWTGGDFAATSLIDRQRVKQLQELTEVVLRRSEAAIDFGAETLDEVASRGPMDCDAAALQAVRLQVYQRSAIKDIRSVNRDGSVICSAYSETLEFDNARVDRTDMLAAPGRGLLLFRLDQINGFALGVLHDIDDKKSLVAILGIDSYVFDIMPADLRQHSAVTLELTSGLNVGRFAAFISDTEDANRFGFSKTSERFPLRATIRVNGEALGNWNREPCKS